jgi:ribosomal protein S18 acetylase RimI-like enzyme
LTDLVALDTNYGGLGLEVPPGLGFRVLIRHGVLADAPLLAGLARQTFFDTFAPLNDPGDMALHLERSYGITQQSAELADPGIATLVVEASGPVLSESERSRRSGESKGELIGYAQLREGGVPECVSDTKAIELWRFYLLQQWHGQGIAQALMERVRAEAAARGAKTLWLGVWERNPRAQAFYRKCGFVDVGDHVFLFGTDPQRDRVMEAKLS